MEYLALMLGGRLLMFTSAASALEKKRARSIVVEPNLSPEVLPGWLVAQVMGKPS